MQPTIGRIVHYVSMKDASQTLAAIVTSVDPNSPPGKIIPSVHLAVLSITAMSFQLGVPYSAQPKAGHWSWPPRV